MRTDPTNQSISTEEIDPNRRKMEAIRIDPNRSISIDRGPGVIIVAVVVVVALGRRVERVVIERSEEEHIRVDQRDRCA
jgi:hypothetical protein